MAPALFDMSPMSFIDALAPNLQVADGFVDEVGAQTLGCSPKAVYVLLPRLSLASGELLLLAAHDTRNFFPQGEVTNVKVWASLRDSEDFDLVIFLGLLGQVAFVSCGIIVFQHRERPLAWTRLLQRLLDRASVEITRSSAIPRTLDFMPHHDFPFSNTCGYPDWLRASVVSEMLCLDNVLIAEALAQLSILAAYLSPRCMITSSRVRINWEKLHILVHVDDLAPPAHGLVTVSLRPREAFLFVFLCKYALRSQSPKLDASLLQRFAHGALTRLAPRLTLQEAQCNFLQALGLLN
jgi:hypothetical protein